MDTVPRGSMGITVWPETDEYAFGLEMLESPDSVMFEHDRLRVSIELNKPRAR